MNPAQQSIRPIEVTGRETPTPVLRGLQSVWKMREGRSHSEPLIRRVLAARNIDDPAFLTPTLSGLHNPSLMPDLDRAARRILDAIEKNQSIVIYADYDVDGVSAAAILWHMIRAIKPDAKVSTYLPHRLEEGYGLNSEAIAKLCDSHALIVSVDCGVTAVAPAAMAKSRGIDLIVTDHHTPPHDELGLPNAFAIVHPKTPGRTPYPFEHLCGAGVAFKLAWRLATIHSGADKANPELRSLLVELLALAAMGVIADVVPLLGENRIIAKFGLARVAESKLAGVRALCDESGLGGDRAEASDIGFRLGPRLNAIGRLGHAREALELMTTADEIRAKEIAAALTGWNDERRKMEAAISKHAHMLATERGMTSPHNRAIVLADPLWHRGVVGICCSRLVGQYHRPAILLQQDGELCHGSARSIDGFDLHEAIASCSEFVESFGGHAMAAGLKVRTDRLELFTQAFVAYANSKLNPEDLVRSTTIDSECRLDELDLSAITQLRNLAPFGRENPEPKLLLRGAKLASPPRTLGTKGAHVVFDLKAGSQTLRVKAWGWGAILAQTNTTLPTGTAVDAVISPEINRWNGRTLVEATLHDLRIV